MQHQQPTQGRRKPMRPAPRFQKLPVVPHWASDGLCEPLLQLCRGVAGLPLGRPCTHSVFAFQLPVIIDLRNPTLKARHWAVIEQTVDAQLVDVEIPLTLERLSELRVFEFGQEIQDISGQASGEAALETILKKVNQERAKYGGMSLSFQHQGNGERWINP